ncbi:MAG: hypothetical protein FJ286_00305 [Planctomycetes bacterium]|nr:hypothetical protein [Planctomycetota bacterium]
MSPRADRAASPTAERILVVCTQYLGDTLLAIPFLRNLRRRHPLAVIDVCAAAGPRALLDACPYIDRFVSWQRPPRRRRRIATAWAGIVAEAAWLRSQRYSRAYLLKPSLSAGVLATLAGIPARIGFHGESGPFLTRRVWRGVGRHQVEAYLDLLRAEGAEVDDAHNENWVAEDAAHRVAALLERLPAGQARVFLAVRTTDPLKLWPADRWRTLLRWLVEDRGCELVLCGGPADRAAHGELLRSCPAALAAHLHDLSAEVPLADAAALMARMDLCIGVDTGMVHLAASVGVPVAVIAGPSDPNRWQPWGTRSVVLRSARLRTSWSDRLEMAARRGAPLGWPLGRADIDDIGVDDVRAAVTPLLAERPVRTLDLTHGSFRYAVVADGGSAVGPVSRGPAPAAAIPAT